MSLEYVLFGNMCSGKTTAAQVLKTHRDFVVVSAKEIIQNNLESAGPDVKQLREKGALLPDDIVIKWVFKEIQTWGARAGRLILDGFPRTRPQAEALLDRYGKIGRVLYLVFDIGTLERRFCGRFVCNDCDMPLSKSFSDFGGRCLNCGSNNIGPRPTDKPNYFSVKTAQFKSVSLKVLPVFEEAGSEFVGLHDHSSFGNLKEEILSIK